MQNKNGAARTVLLVDATGELTHALKGLLRARKFALSIAGSPLEALRTAMTTPLDVVVCDLQGASMSPATFEAAIERVRPSLGGRCFFIAPAEAAPDSRETLMCYRPLDIPELLRAITFLAAQPGLEEDAALAGTPCR